MTFIPRSEFLKHMFQRGFLNQHTDINKLDEEFTSKIVVAYIGFDCTAPRLHVGSLIQIMKLRWLQKSGHKPIVLLGGGTTKIGDPSGKNESRLLLDSKTISNNMKSIKTIFEYFLEFDNNPYGALLVDNSIWLQSIDYLEFLREYGKHFSINRMLSFDSVKNRLEKQQNLSFLEFNYMILQAYDFVELHKRYNCMLQLGGSDQWGNIVNGIELARRLGSKNGIKHSLHGITSPLITSSSGEKMGKTAAGAIWLNPDKTSAYDYWQFWRNTEDNDVKKFLYLFTEIDIHEVERLSALSGSEINEAKIILANHTTTFIHGKSATNEVVKTSKKVFELHDSGSSLPIIEIDKITLSKGIQIFRIFSKNGILCSTNSEAKRLIRNGGARLNNQQLENENFIIDDSFFSPEGTAKLSAGKKKHAILKKVD